jgi:hypothetical protein
MLISGMHVTITDFCNQRALLRWESTDQQVVTLIRLCMSESFLFL